MANPKFHKWDISLYIFQGLLLIASISLITIKFTSLGYSFEKLIPEITWQLQINLEFKEPGGEPVWLESWLPVQNERQKVLEEGMNNGTLQVTTTTKFEIHTVWKHRWHFVKTGQQPDIPFLEEPKLIWKNIDIIIELQQKLYKFISIYSKYRFDQIITNNAMKSFNTNRSFDNHIILVGLLFQFDTATNKTKRK